jgi:DNA mismatch repair protein MutL
MARIHVLSENLANRIAAGEVVERPASIVKELVENAIDAGATRIEVELVEGGRKLIRVVDNGHGMPPEDLPLAVQRFATSKITAEDDLGHIATMGFRGEALPSIGAVAHLKIITREPESDAGTIIIIEGGTQTQLGPTGCPPGTSVEVANLFFNTPARLKFLGTSATERGHCGEWVSRLALARPDIAFKLTHNGAVIFNTPGAGDGRAVLSAIYGSNAAREFLPVDLHRVGLHIHGYVSGPKLLRATKQYQQFFVNQRFVRSKSLSYAVTEAYGMLLPAGKQPLCALHIDVSPDEVDPNVHPTKIEVRFRGQGEMHSLVQMAVEETLAEAGFRSLTQASRRRVGAEGPGAGPLPAGRFFGARGDDLARAKRLRVNPFMDSIDERDDGLEVFGEKTTFGTQATTGEPDETDFEDTSTPVAHPPQRLIVPDEQAEAAPDVIGQVGNRYILAAAGDDMLVIDQHRAAERVGLEKMQADLQRQARQLLVAPVTLEFTPQEAAVVEANREAIAAAGFEVEPFGAASFLLRSVPATLVNANPEAALQAIVEELASVERSASQEKRAELALATAACHAAIKAGQRLSMEEMTRLVRDLYAVRTPAVCPHGDPIIVSLELGQLDRRFGR